MARVFICRLVAYSRGPRGGPGVINYSKAETEALSAILTEWEERGKRIAELETHAEYINKGWHLSIERAESAERSLVEARERIDHLNDCLVVSYDTTRQRTEHLRTAEGERDSVREKLAKVVEKINLTVLDTVAVAQANMDVQAMLAEALDAAKDEEATPKLLAIIVGSGRDLEAKGE